MRKFIAAAVVLIMLVMAGCQFGNPQDFSSKAPEEVKPVDISGCATSLYGVLDALFEQNILPYEDPEKSDLLGYFKEDTGEEVDESTIKHNNDFRELADVGKISANIRVMSADVIGAVRGVRLLYKDTVTGMVITMEIYEYDPATMDQNEYVKSAREKNSYELMGYTVNAEMFGKYLLLYSDTSGELENISRKSTITNTLEKLSAAE